MLGTLIGMAVPTVLNYFGERRRVSRSNRERLKQSERDAANYINDFNRDVVLWENESNDRDIAVDTKWQEVLSKIASDDLRLWSGISQGGLATQQAYATMMSVGATEQTGARSSTTTNRRKAVLTYASTMANVASKLSLSSDNAALNRDTWGNEFNRFAQESHVKTITGRPMPGTPPPPIPLENKPDLLTGLILPLAGNFINWRAQVEDLSSPYSDDDMRPAPGPPDQNPSPNPNPTPGPIPIPMPSPPSSQQTQLWGDFFDKTSRNRASSGLGSSFYTTAT